MSRHPMICGTCHQIDWDRSEKLLETFRACKYLWSDFTSADVAEEMGLPRNLVTSRLAKLFSLGAIRRTTRKRSAGKPWHYDINPSVKVPRAVRERSIRQGTVARPSRAS